MPSPSAASVRTSITAPDPRSFGRSNFHRATLSPAMNSIDPSLTHDFTFLAPPGYDPIARQFQEQPWSARNLRSSNTSNSSSRSPLRQPNGQHEAYQKTRSNIDPSDDSGYCSQPAASLLGNEPDQTNSDLASSFSQKVDTLNVEPVPTEAPRMARMLSDQRSQVSKQSSRSNKQFPCVECREVMKCNSDLTYVYSLLTAAKR
jgi:uncharacterized Zn-finger protein